MSGAQDKPLSIVSAHGHIQLSSGQQAFNALIGQIGKRRARLVAWGAAIPPYQQKFSSQLLPLLESLAALQDRLVQCLDHASYDKSVSRFERQMIAELMARLARDQSAEQDDAGIFAGQADLPVEPQACAANPPLRRRKSARQQAREAAQQDQARQMGQSIREVYRKLASALHPDRETDPAELIRKTVLMQRVNLAYEKNDLLRMLELQLELEHIDQAALNSISEGRLQHYNRILQEQLVDLEAQIRHVENEFKAQFGLPPPIDVSPGTIMRDLAAEIRDVQYVIDGLKRDLREFGDISRVKAWLKRARQQGRMDGERRPGSN